MERGYHRKGVGSFHAPSRAAVDDLHGWLVQQGVTVLYGGPQDAPAPNYAVFFEDPDRVKLEYVYRRS